MDGSRGGDGFRARRWRHAGHAAVCDVLQPWTYGTVVRASRYPHYHEFNLVRVERDPQMGAEALASFADAALDGLAHRRVDFESIRPAEQRRAGFEALGWRSGRLLWMRHDGAAPRGGKHAVSEVPYDDVGDLRTAWHREDEDEDDSGEFPGQAREVALSRGVQVLGLRDGGVLVGFAQLLRTGRAAEIAQVYVLPAYRGAGRGTSVTIAAIEAAGDVQDLWICADDEGRAKHLYARLGFRPAWTVMEFWRRVDG